MRELIEEARRHAHAARDHGPSGTGAELTFTGLRRVYRPRRGSREIVAIEGVALTLAAGARVALLGPNGSGKSTLLRLLCGLDRPDAGTIAWRGRRLWPKPDPSDDRAFRATLGMVFQTPSLDALLSVRENLHLACALHGLTRAEALDRVARFAAAVGVTDRIDDRVGTLSGGLARRADLARAMLHRPSLLVLDEPTAGLDLAARSSFLEVAAGGAWWPDGRRGTLIVSTHHMDEAERCDRVVMLAGGRVVADGTPAQLRAGVGARVIEGSSHAEAERAAALLGACGLSAARHGDRWSAIAGPGAEHAAARFASEAARLGIGFSWREPTLGDAYLAATGAPLSESDAA